MKHISRILIGLTAIAANVLPANAENGWTVNQSATGGAALTGAMTLYITPSGMRAIDAKNGINLMTHAPDWTVYIFNDKTRRVFSSPLQTWLTSFKQRNMVGRFQGATWRRGRADGRIANARAYEFVMDHPPPARQNYKGLNGKTTKLNTLTGASLWVATDIATPPQVSNILSNLYGVPDCQRIPLRVVLMEAGRGQSNAVETVRAMQGNIPENVFQPPRGYQPTKQDTDVFIDKESMDALDEMLNDIDSPSSRRPAARPGVPQQRQGQQQYRR